MYIIALIEIVFGCLEHDTYYLSLAIVEILIAKEMKEGK
jgi:hypothetical protein